MLDPQRRQPLRVKQLHSRRRQALLSFSLTTWMWPAEAAGEAVRTCSGQQCQRRLGCRSLALQQISQASSHLAGTVRLQPRCVLGMYAVPTDSASCFAQQSISRCL